MSTRLLVIIPAHNEEKYLVSCLDSFLAQTDKQFELIVVDNVSTDKTAAIARDWRAKHSGIKLHLLQESRKGTGWACRKGFNYAIQNGATWLARTDADCLVSPDWVRTIRTNLNSQDFVYGGITFRKDEKSGIGLQATALLTYYTLLLWVTAARVWRPSYKKKVGLSAGANLAITRKLYEAVGDLRAPASLLSTKTWISTTRYFGPPKRPPN